MQLELKHWRAECRFMSVLMVVLQMFNMIDPALLILGTPSAIVTRVAGLSGHPLGMVLVFVFGAICMVPYGVMQIVQPDERLRRRLVRLAMLGLVLGGVQWIFLSYLCRNLDFGSAGPVFLRNGGFQILFAALLGAHLNNQLKRELEYKRLRSLGAR